MKKQFTKLLAVIILLIYSQLNFAQTATPPSVGNGTSGSPYEIATIENLYWLSTTSAQWASGKYFKQTANIDASSVANFPTIGNSTTSFNGNYNGQGFLISNLVINRPAQNYIGLFGSTQDGSISNLGLVNASIVGKDYVGSIVGYGLETIISKVFSTGTITGHDYVGGLISWAEDGTVGNSYSMVNVNGNSSVAGFIGVNNFCTLSNSYSIGAVSGASTLGGFISQNTGVVTNCFWNTETSGQATSTAGDGLTTAEMKNLCSYPTTWFTSNWTLNSSFNNGYPALAWQGSAHTASCSTTWNGSSWDFGTPTASTDAIINGNYNELTGFETKNLTINSGFTLVVPSMQTVIVNGNLENNGTIWLKSQLGSIQASGALITKAALTNNGTMKAEKFLTLKNSVGNNNWHLVGSPLVGNLPVESVFLNDYAYRYNSTLEWQTLISEQDQIISKEGYLVQTVKSGGKNVLFSGTFNTGDATFTLVPSPDSWNLVSNPFPSAIDLEQISLVNATNYFYVWNLADQNYKFYIKGDVANSTASPFVQSMQGFFAGLTGATKSAGPTNSSITIPNTARVDNGVFSPTKSKINTANLHFSINSSENANDHVIVRFGESDFVVEKFFSLIPSAPQSYIIGDNANLSLTTFSDPTAERVVPVAFESSLEGEYIFKIENLGLSAKVLLFDRILNTFTELNSETIYTFSHLASNDKHRFDLYFNPKTTDLEQIENELATIYSQNQTICIRLAKSENTTISVFDLSGRKLNELTTNKQTTEITGLQQGIYIVKLKNTSGWQTAKVLVK